jgi:N-acetylmuramoyl-L-alanine amidase
MLKRCLIFMLILMLPALCWADASDRAYDKARKSYYRLQDSQKDRLYRHNWLKVVALFDQVYENYPDGRRAADALFMSGKTTFELYGISGLKEDARNAAGYFDQLPNDYPASRLADDALNFSAKIHETILEEPTPAYKRYKRIVTIYPDGDMKNKAEARLDKLARYKPVIKTAPKNSPRTAVSSENRLNTIRFWSNPGYTRIVLEMDRKIEFTSNFLKGDPKQGKSPRIYVDLQQTVPVDNLIMSQDVNDGLLTKIRAGKPDNGTTRVVLDLESFGDYKVFPLAEPFRIVIDVQGEGKVASTPADTADSADTSSGQDDIAGLLNSPPKERPLRVQIPETRTSGGLRRIVVDAGHGGKDPGAVGPSGVFEKKVVLALAKVLAKKLEKELNCEVIMTRTGDTFLELEERTAIANKVGADLFISIHANANRNRRARGIETYYLNFSKNAAAVEVVARENKTSLKQVGDLELILMDLLANSKINESSRLASEIQKAMVKNLKRHYKVKDLGVRQGPFYVLLGATMPSVLVETAFISNRTEEKLLTNRKYQERAADAIVKGVRNYATALKLLAVR